MVYDQIYLPAIDTIVTGMALAANTMILVVLVLFVVLVLLVVLVLPVVLVVPVLLVVLVAC